MSVLLIAGVVYGVMGLVTVVAYALDKSAARRGGRRISEATLHLFELLGGWPGAAMAQRLFRHKTAKPGYQLVFWMIGLLHLMLWIAVLRLRG